MRRTGKGKEEVEEGNGAGLIGTIAPTRLAHGSVITTGQATRARFQHTRP